ncbi:MAG: hypothetical protein JNL02_02215 [Saprospiraceae bacterium]|nr:hypothetical protein [Saprospiraceae bacterium]
MKKYTFLALSLPLSVVLLALFPFAIEEKPFHTPAELQFFETLMRGSAQGHGAAPDLLPIDSNILFPTSKSCGGCHGHDPNMFALITTDGKDVNIYDDWRSTMMANSAKDPFWRAKVTHEILVNPAHSLELQNKCTSCHAPAGHYQAKLKRHEEFYTLADLYTDSLGLDGVTCQACHAQSPQLLGTLNSGNLHFDTNFIRVAYGPYEFAFAPPMHNFVGITPLYGPHIADGGLCAGCHTLITDAVDLQGNLTGTSFVEQATYHEWLNSRYDKEHDNVSCQACHVPQINDEIIISANYQFLTPKSPYGLHELAGANVTMLKLLRDNRQALDIDAEAEHFDSTIAATLRMLQEKSLDISLSAADLNGDTVQFDLGLVNKAGHKFPSGYPARRAWVEFIVKNETGETVFHSGRYNPDFSLPDEDPNFEPHYNVINRADQVQIYELVPGDVTGNFTNVLERCHSAMKDNRLVPSGFLLSDPAYDTTAIVGSALNDPDFNFSADGQEGSGSDRIHYRIPLDGYAGTLTVTARVWYQSLPPKWMTPIFEWSSPEIDSFKVMFEAADRSPILVAEKTLGPVAVTPVSSKTPTESAVRISPTLSTDGRVVVTTASGVTLRSVRVYDAHGRLVWDRSADNTIWLPAERGVYYVAVETSRGRFMQKVARQ